MPSHVVHDAIAFVSAPLAAGAAAGLLLWGDFPLREAAIGGGVFALSHLVCSYWLSPDLDIRSAIAPRWGPLAVLWKPYEYLIPHRSWLSHSGVSALLRLLYLGLIVSLVLSATGMVTGVYDTGLWLYDMARQYPLFTLLVLGGAVFADLLHVVADMVTTEIRHFTGVLTLVGVGVCVWLFL